MRIAGTLEGVGFRVQGVGFRVWGFSGHLCTTPFATGYDTGGEGHEKRHEIGFMILGVGFTILGLGFGV